ncbi:hypothetical protein [Winogradskya humida]|uniref:Uncharacterized protein n=1 Tax=Winogradskya humida TaxID=113566 RepID=A0ABQ3ZXN4_9ACTN|nr:hypothetical protein [Actinoplanes humidus]GIE23350.1 hypothetical protein Ahu01nite_064520 [Actinoplanes humidus]
MTQSPTDRLETARAAVAQLVADVRGEGRRGAFWLPRLLDLEADLTRTDRPAEDTLTVGKQHVDFLYSAPRDSFAEFYLMNDDPDDPPGRFSATQDTLWKAVGG